MAELTEAKGKIDEDLKKEWEREVESVLEKLTQANEIIERQKRQIEHLVFFREKFGSLLPF